MVILIFSHMVYSCIKFHDVLVVSCIGFAERLLNCGEICDYCRVSLGSESGIYEFPSLLISDVGLELEGTLINCSLL